MTMHKSVAAIVIALFCGLSAAAQDRGPSTPEARKQALELARALERDPLHRNARDARAWLTMWVASVPDITVEVCGEFMKPLLDAKKHYASELFVQSIFSSAAFVIEHPAEKDNAHAKYLAGVEGTLRAYEAIREAKPNVRWKILDELIAKRDAGELAAYVREKMRACTN